ncbi:hypothetical protein F4561_000088 [Lipingzhangella halophila]|uniref:Tetratricopeptide repeat protein n=1 Tax=Lipingzhangella halophila TaxID=1783352 RepID=A0A7W7RC50_9ACTN|nr:hypothetical protein [Lipingzhangella halophila]MBB4929268.1 hypothetical protein [Lipingzhangella halophila]
MDAARAAGDHWVEGVALRQSGALRWERDRDSEAIALTGIEEARVSFGETDRARQRLGAALDILRSFGAPRAGDVEATLARLN